jgi:hypothetical protein
VPSSTFHKRRELPIPISAGDHILSQLTTLPLQEGSCVRLKREVENFPIGIFPAGLTGTLVKIGQQGDYWVKLDRQYLVLAALSNELLLWDWSGESSSDEHPNNYLEIISEE